MAGDNYRRHNTETIDTRLYQPQRAEIVELDGPPCIHQFAPELNDPDSADTELSGEFDATAYQLPTGEAEAMLHERKDRLTRFHKL